MVKPYQRIVALVCIACENSECEKCNVEDLSKRIIDDVRADTIDEYKDRLLELCDGGEECVECVGGKCTGCLENSIDYSSIVDLAEELKEKNL